jgi:gliding motility-associated-like protein
MPANRVLPCDTPSQAFCVRASASILLSLCALFAHAAERPVATFTENRGQWPEQVLYRSLFPGGALFVEKNAFTFELVKGGPLAHHGHDPTEAEEPFQAHAYRVTFEGSQPARGEGRNVQAHYENFFLGKDASHWGTHCGVFGAVVLHDIYPGIDLRIDGAEGLKYEFRLKPGVDPSIIRMRFDGQDGLRLKDGSLVVRTTAGDVVEEAPVSWAPFFDGIDNHRIHASSAYKLRGNTVSFDVKAIKGLPLTIDPELTFGSYSGSTADNFGFTATYDNDGALYGGGIVFDLGYPTTLGVLQPSFAGLDIDIGLSKWSPDGTALEWSTYLGGSNNETPNSLVVNSVNELFVLAVTGSSNFPTTVGCYDATFNGGTPIPLTGGFVNLAGGEGYGFDFGTDIVVAHLSSDATTLIGSTYVGGAGNDGLNQSAALVHNYGDHFRGEIALDALERPVVASSTQSVDMPTTAGTAQQVFGGGDLDAILFRLSADLTSLQMATYCGGDQGDSGNGVQLSSTGDIYLTGGTASSNLPMVGSAFNNSNAGSIDGHVMRYSEAGQLLGSTYIGTASYDQCFFVQLDTQDAVYVVGQTHGAYPVTPGKYTNTGSSQFIHKLATDLSTSVWSTVIGNGNGDEDISPSAFLVSNCQQIYFSGWGGSVNTFVNADLSTTIGLPVTADAYQPNTDGSDFYLMVLEPEAAALNYATFFGGGTSAEHVDGGTSRFDKNGNVYQAVCAGCNGNDDFPTTPGAWSNTNNSFNCNLGVFKFNLGQPEAFIAIDGPDVICVDGTVQFINNSVGGTQQVWDFGDSNTSTAFEPEHTYTDPGTYTVIMLLDDSSSCTPTDTGTIVIHVIAPQEPTIDPIQPICDGATIQLHAHGGYQFLWFPTTGLSDPTSADPFVTADSSITYSVIVTDSCGVDTASIDVVVGIPFGEACPDTLTCAGQPVPITAIGGGTYAWSPAASLDDPNVQTPLASPLDTTEYVVTITTPEGCIVLDTVVVNVEVDVPVPVVGDTAVCLGGSVQLLAQGGTSFAWQPAPGITDLNIPDPVVTPQADQYFVVTMTNTCGSATDSAYVDVRQVIAFAWPDTIVCPGEQVTLFASGGTVYQWSPTGGLTDPQAATTATTVQASTTYTVTVGDPLGCEDEAMVTVNVFPDPTVNAGQDTGIDFGDQVQLVGLGNGSMVWSPALTLSCDSCAAPVAEPVSSTTYTVLLTDANGCTATDEVTVFVNGSLFVPNTFTPNGDGVNDSFFAKATEVKEFRLLVFNRWGEEIFGTTQLSQAWDGSYHGASSPIDTYVWRVDLTELNGKKRTVFGHVNLVR